MNNLADKVKMINLLILDIDGILSSGIIYYADQKTHVKGFHVHDGLGIQLLQKAGIKVAIISAKKSKGVAKRLAELEIAHVYLGQNDKLAAYDEIKQKLSLKDSAIAYMGDDLPDLPLLRRVGLPITVPEASEIIRKHAVYVTQKSAGHGAVREVCDALLTIQGKYNALIKDYFK